MGHNLDHSELDRRGILLSTEPEFHFISERRNGSDELAIFDTAKALKSNPVAQIVFGGNQFSALASAYQGNVTWPQLWLQGDVCVGNEISGVQSLFAENSVIRSIVQDGRVVGSYWEDEDAEYVLLAGILPAALGASRGAQTTSVFERIESALAAAGLDFSHVARTWLYLDRLLDWYDEFNLARTEFFEKRGVFAHLIPASTGIGASNPFGAALTAGALAIRGKHDGVSVREVVSPLQCEATEYRSSFSRAVEINLPGRRYLTISGTASIAPEGQSLHQDDVVKQIHTTLDVVEAILKSHGYGWDHTVRAIGYFRNIEDLAVFDAISKERGIPPLPLAPAHAIVCRDDLLFEIELDAISFGEGE